MVAVPLKPSVGVKMRRPSGPIATVPLAELADTMVNGSPSASRIPARPSITSGRPATASSGSRPGTTGASLTGVTVTSTIASAVPPCPSEMV